MKTQRLGNILLNLDVIYDADKLNESFPIECPDLVAQYYRFLFQTTRAARQQYFIWVNGAFRFS